MALADWSFLLSNASVIEYYIDQTDPLLDFGSLFVRMNTGSGPRYLSARPIGGGFSSGRMRSLFRIDDFTNDFAVGFSMMHQEDSLNGDQCYAIVMTSDFTVQLLKFTEGLDNAPLILDMVSDSLPLSDVGSIYALDCLWTAYDTYVEFSVSFADDVLDFNSLSIILTATDMDSPYLVSEGEGLFVRVDEDSFGIQTLETRIDSTLVRRVYA